MEYSEEETKYRDKLIADIEEIMVDLEHLLEEPSKPELRVIKGEG
jgi:hypothetical protein